MPTYRTAANTFAIQATQYDTGAALNSAGAVCGAYFGPDIAVARGDSLPFVTLGAGVRNAAPGDEIIMHTLLVTPVNGGSPLDELQADYGADAASFTPAGLRARIDDSTGTYALLLAQREQRVLGWTLYVHQDHLTEIGIPTGGADVWEYSCLVAEKGLALADRIEVATKLMLAGALRLNPGDYIWGDVRTPGNLDSHLTPPTNPSVPVTSHGVACNRYWWTVGQLIAELT